MVFMGCPIKHGDVGFLGHGSEVRPENFVFLVAPEGDPSALLGVSVEHQKDGGWVFGRSRPRGCFVQDRMVEAIHRREGFFIAQKNGMFLAEVPWLASLTAKYGDGVWMYTGVDNHFVLYGAFHGHCEGYFVTAVHVGTGERQIGAGGSAGARAVLEPPVRVRARVSMEARYENVSRVSWVTPLAYAVEISRLGHVESHIGLHVDMPRTIRHQEKLFINITSKEDSYLIVAFVKEDGSGGILIPSSADKLSVASRDVEVSLGPAYGIVDDGAVQAREVLIVYAIRRYSDHQRVRPKTSDFHPSAVHGYLEKVAKILERVPVGDWAVVTRMYTIRR